MTKKPAKVNPRSATPEHKLIGEKVRAARLKAGISQDDLGKALGLSFQQVQKYEKGTNRIEVTRMMAIAKILDVDLKEFTGVLDVKRSPSAKDFDAVLATREGVQIIEAMKKLSDKQRQFLIDVARRLPQIAEA